MLMNTKKKKTRKSRSSKLKSFLEKPSKKNQSMVLSAGKEVVDSIDDFLEMATSGRTDKTIQEFYKEFLKEELGISFSSDTLRRYCKKHRPKLWEKYKEVRSNGN